MDFMKVVDQAVREIKREVNLKVLKVPEIEQKVLDATDDEPWGPHGTTLAEISQATTKFSECQMVMNVLWTRLTETGRNWRLVYKALTVIEYLIGHGSERAVDDIIEHTFQISSLASFEYVEPSGKDMGINVRKKAETIVSLLNNKDKIQEVRHKASANRDKYFGLSSTGITYKSGSASFSGSSLQSSDQYGGFGNTDQDSYSEDKFTSSKSCRGVSGKNEEHAPMKGSSSKVGDSSSVNVSKQTAKTNDSDKYASIPSQSSAAPSNNDDEDFDDFNPRGSSNAKPAVGSSNQVDLLGDLLDAPAPVIAEKPSLNNSSSEVDLFADASFVSAPSHADARDSSNVQVDLFGTYPSSSPAASSTIDLFAASDSIGQPETNSSKSEPLMNDAVDPFAAVPLNNFDGSDPFGAFTYSTESISAGPAQHPINDGNQNRLNEKSPVEAKSPPNKDSFQVKSGIWADSLSRGLIDLNITAPKRVNLADLGIVGGLTDGSDEKEKGPPTSFYMGRAMGAGSGFGKSGFSSTATGGDDFFSTYSNPQ